MNIAAPGGATGTIVTTDLITETQVEDDIDARSTLIRIVGQLQVFNVTDFPILRFGIFAGVSTGLGATGVLAAENFNDPRLVWSYEWGDDAASPTVQQATIHVDIRAKRRLLVNTEVALVTNNIQAATDEALVRGHLRCLVLLP